MAVMDRRRHALAGMLAVGWLAGAAHAKEAPPTEAAVPDAEVADVKAAREVGAVLTDGKGHYVVVGVLAPTPGAPFKRTVMFYGDGITFHQVDVSAAHDEKQSTWTIRDERMGLEPGRSSLLLRDRTYTVMCGDATTALTQLPAAEAGKLLAKAAFKRERMDRVAHALGRDGTTYYYVDRALRPAKGPDFRVYAGKRGALKRLVIKNVAADAQGTVFTAKSGTLRVTTEPLSLAWGAKPAKQIALTALPIESNLELVYRELGVYAAKRFGVPCDDL